MKEKLEQGLEKLEDSVESVGSTVQDFLKMESASGIVLMFAAFLAMLLANSPLAHLYAVLLDTPVELRLGVLHIAKPLLLWVNDGLMAVFFLLVGLELKREVLVGELSNLRTAMLPAIGAVGGMAIPAAIYIYLNFDDPVAIQGWAIPAATDIAFALGVLSLLGSRVPTSLKIFLTSLAIFDDVGSIVIIAIFYTAQISMSALIVTGACIVVLSIMNRLEVTSKSFYILVGVIMWVSMLKSGVHATLTGVILAMFIPMQTKSNPDYSPLQRMEHDLHSVVAFFILPVFAFANAGIALFDVSLPQLTHPVPLGIALGLLVGKQIGIFGLCWLGVQFKLVDLPKGMNWPRLWGTSALCGIGFTMSLFIGSLAFEETGINLLVDERIGIVIGSLLSGVLGYVILYYSLVPKQHDESNH